MTRYVTLATCLFLAFAASGAKPPLLRWGGDAEGGAPFVEADPADPSKVKGFDVEVAEAIARGLGQRASFVQVAYASIDQSVQRGDADIGMSGLEDTPARRVAMATSIPYYIFTYTLTVRSADRRVISGLSHLRGKRIGAMGGTVGYQLLVDDQGRYGLSIVVYDDDVHPYEDLLRGRIDAVLLDNVLAARAMRRTPGLYTHFDKPVSKGYYVVVTARENVALRDRVNEILVARMRDGTLERIYRKWGIWNDLQQPLFNELVTQVPADRSAKTKRSRAVDNEKSTWIAVSRYFPALLRAAVISILVSIFAMAMAIVIGSVVASGRVYGNARIRLLLTTYVEVIRGTPLLLQLFVVYYGLSGMVQLPAMLAAVVALGLNYAAYESEIYRGAIEAVAPGQLEAARALGLTELQVFRFVRAPQAFRLALAPMTNDFVALLKDSSLVSVITVVELTKQTQMFATNIGSWTVPGAGCALLYLAMSMPIARLAGRIRKRWKPASI